MPWPTSWRTTEKPSLSTLFCTAKPMSPRWLPGRHCSTASNSDARVVASRRLAMGVTFPIGIVTAASATQPSRITPMSIERMSPRLSL